MPADVCKSVSQQKQGECVILGCKGIIVSGLAYIQHFYYQLGERSIENMVADLLSDITPKIVPIYPDQSSLAESYRAITACISRTAVADSQSGYSTFARSAPQLEASVHVSCQLNVILGFQTGLLIGGL